MNKSDEKSLTALFVLRALAWSQYHDPIAKELLSYVYQAIDVYISKDNLSGCQVKLFETWSIKIFGEIRQMQYWTYLNCLMILSTELSEFFKTTEVSFCKKEAWQVIYDFCSNHEVTLHPFRHFIYEDLQKSQIVKNIINFC